ncbi:MAG: metalloendopeptidase [Desulfobacterium sp.]|nr:metalloendopeptidase [Desulfobacterium sp.]
MRRYYTLSLLGEVSQEIHQITFSRRILVIFCGVLMIGMTVFPFLISNHYQLKKNRPPNIRELTNIEKFQKKEIQQQDIQINHFTSEIRKLKTSLAMVQKSEKEVRLIANIGEADHASSIFGIGGSIGGDSDTILGPEQIDPMMGRKMFQEHEYVNNRRNIQPVDVEALEKKLGRRQNLLASTPIIYPSIGWETSGFGYQRSPFAGQRVFHKGLDIAAATGTSVVSPANGIITFAGPRGVWGITLIVEHGHGLVTQYSHLSKVEKTEGSQVKRGETIAYVGNTGKCFGPHLHYEVRLHGIPVNPKKYIMFTPSFIHEAFIQELQVKNKRS